MATKDDLKDWVIQALMAHRGEAPIIGVAKHIWDTHESELRASGDLFYSWQYDMRWAADQLRREGRLQPKPKGDRGPWRLA
jgi:hypothetical protein